jgi:hydroxymethylpyrimidine pyrophosphatase-like HAD family hydrolase
MDGAEHHQHGLSSFQSQKEAKGHGGLLKTELLFYQNYRWCLNPCPTFHETITYLKGELSKLEKLREEWHVTEVMTNVFLLSCALLNSADDYQAERFYRLPRRARLIPLVRRAPDFARKLSRLARRSRVASVRRWKRRWQTEFDAFLAVFFKGQARDPKTLTSAANALANSLELPLPADLQTKRTCIPSAFRKQDLTHFDTLALGRQFVDRFPDRQRPVLIVGLRTGGSYSGPLLRAFLTAEGYETVDAMTVRPKQGLAAWERAELVRCSNAGYLAAIVDDPPASGGTIALIVDEMRQLGFPLASLVGLIPVHPRRREWRGHVNAASLSDVLILSLGVEEWYKYRQLASEIVQSRLREYFQGCGYTEVSVVADRTADLFNAQLEYSSGDPRRDRLKRIYAVRLETPTGEIETRYVLAKSVGWGWLGYHAFLVGHQLGAFVAPVLGLRDGILYTEWIPQTNISQEDDEQRVRWIETASSYVAARVHTLRFERDPSPGYGSEEHEAFQGLDSVLCKAYGGPGLAAKLRRRTVRALLSRHVCPFPTLIDGRMRRQEWIKGPGGPLKADFEHHGMGKNELNVTDPAYDLADAILQFELSPQEEKELILRYVAETGDNGVQERLFLHKLLAGSHELAAALYGLLDRSQPSHRASEHNEQYVRAWNFLIAQTVRFCAGKCQRPQAPLWDGPLAVLDIDGVLDRRIFGFPSTTAAGIRALSLLDSHGFVIAVNTARSAAEVKEYCNAYGFVGGVAEYGSYIWDAAAGNGRGLVSVESLEQMERLRQALGHVPGIFFNDSYEFSIRAYSYDSNGTVPIPSPTIHDLISSLNLDCLRWHQTHIDTTIVAKEVDKGRGLAALLTHAGRPRLETIAIGDSEPDIPMFHAAQRSFAPAQISCASLARLAGCQIARRSNQMGLLEIVRSLIHPGGDTCPRCQLPAPSLSGRDELFMQLLEAADRRRVVSLFRAMVDPKSYRLFVQ